MSRWLVAVLVASLFGSSAVAGELIEMQDGELIEADEVVVTERQFVLRVAPGVENTVKDRHVRLEDVEPMSAVRAWAATLSDDDAAGWLRLADFARATGLFDVAELGYERAAETSELALDTLTAFRADRAGEESRHHFRVAIDLFDSGRRGSAAEEAQLAVDADADGAYAAMGRELLALLEEGNEIVAVRPVNSRDARALKRLESYAARGAARLESATGRSPHDRTVKIHSATRLLGGVALRLQPLASRDVDESTRARALRALADVQQQRVTGLLQLADLRLQDGADRTAMTAVHEVLAITPNDARAVDLRDRLLDRAEPRAQEGAVRRVRISGEFRGAARRRHPYPYPARDSRVGIGLEPTWDPIRGLGKVQVLRTRPLSRRSRRR